MEEQAALNNEVKPKIGQTRTTSFYVKKYAMIFVLRMGAYPLASAMRASQNLSVQVLMRSFATAYQKKRTS